MWELQSEWYSPTRMNSNPITQYDFPGDRFIPNRSLMDLDQARSLLSNRTTPNRNSNFNEVYRKSIEDKLTLDSEGNPFRMLVFRGSPKSNRKSIRCVDLMRQDEAKELDGNGKHHQPRRLPKGEARILDAPNIRNDFYMSTMDWGKNNVIAIALGKDLFLWNAENREVHKLLQVDDLNDFPSSVAWSQDAKTVAVGFRRSKLQLWDAETSKLVRSLENHKDRIASITWNGHTLTSGSRDKSIINHDGEGNILASGGNENLLYIWDSSKMNSQRFLFRLKDHRAAVKALAWCPYQSEVLASGEAQRWVCGLEWNRHHKEIMSGHGYSASELIKNQLCLWRYPSMDKVGSLNRYTSRVLHLSQSPDGLTVVSAVADGSLRFLEVFGPPSIDKSRISPLDGLLSLKISPIR
ncbi:cell division cycle 20.3 cofactor of APC complex isoform X2 [Prunus yedoensis var. nudiflora]|uniref:Cell division cycle 20.3 cofactor of APC complex isoform X2 n=1 Tax=Prunus yedoensis var. nudiflora TaxID=2094558 RepID=A0A314UXG6_PRUYE|nr:cell division cycle 20.3 cofactor of APC complex isoform X2 [Prunus yedoensis var. nudiflora]